MEGKRDEERRVYEVPCPVCCHITCLTRDREPASEEHNNVTGELSGEGRVREAFDLSLD